MSVTRRGIYGGMSGGQLAPFFSYESKIIPSVEDGFSDLNAEEKVAQVAQAAKEKKVFGAITATTLTIAAIGAACAANVLSADNLTYAQTHSQMIGPSIAMCMSLIGGFTGIMYSDAKDFLKKHGELLKNSTEEISPAILAAPQNDTQSVMPASLSLKDKIGAMREKMFGAPDNSPKMKI